jgi:hypothetical protein
VYEIAAVRTVPSDDASHQHVDLVGYVSPHMPDEPIFISIPRLLGKMALDEKFAVRVGDQMAEVSAAKCPICGFEPALKTSADPEGAARLMALPAR